MSNIIQNVFKEIESVLGGISSGTFNESINAKTPNKTVVPGDIDLKDIILISEDQTRSYSLMSQVSTIDIYECITSPVIFAELRVADSIGLLESFPILGEEYVKISFTTPKSGNAVTNYVLRVNKVIDKELNSNNKRLSYTLQLVSAELINSSNKLITKNITDSISNIVSDIIKTNIATSKPVKIDTTSGIDEILFTKFTPFRAIDYLRQRAISSEYKSSSFCFFENKNGYNFTTIEKLIDTGSKTLAKSNHSKTFFFDTARKDSFENVTVRNILAYNQVSFIDTMSKVADGGLNNIVQQFDLITGDIKQVTYTDNIGADAFKKTSSSSVNTNTSGFTKKHGMSTSVTKFIPVRSDKPKVFLQEKISNLQAYTHKISQNITLIQVYGDNSITVGDMIECRLPSGIDSAKDRGTSRLLTGNYLVSKVRHSIINGDRPQHTMSLELIKGDLQV